MRARVLLAVSAIFATAEQAAAQQYGQWWWEGEIRWGQSVAQGRRGDVETRNFERSGTGVRLDLNGFLGHPAIGEFSIGVNHAQSDYRGALTSTSEAVGYQLGLKLIPRSSFPITISASKSIADFPGTEEGARTSLGGILSETEHLRAVLYAGRGPLSGTHLDLTSSRFKFADPSRRPDSRDERILTWRRKIGNFNHNLKVRNETSLSGEQRLNTDIWLASLDQSGEFGPWHSFVVLRGARLEIENLGADLRSESLAASSSLSRGVRESDAVILSASFSRSGDPLGPSADQLGIGVGYQWRPRAGWIVSPSAQYRTTDSAEGSVDAIQAGLSLSRSVELGRLRAQLTAGASHTQSTARRTGATTDSSSTGAVAALSLSHDSVSGWLQRIEFSYSQDEFSSAARTATVFAEDEIFALVGRQDQMRGRWQVDRRFGSLTLGGSVEWSQAKEARSLLRPRAESEGRQGVIQVGWRRIGLIGQFTESRTLQQGELFAELESGNATLTLQIARSLTLSAHYRNDRRLRPALPTAETEQIDGSLSFALGRLTLYAGAYELHESLEGQPLRVDRGLRWGVSRRLGGWLPIVTGAQRRGTIR